MYILQKQHKIIVHIYKTSKNIVFLLSENHLYVETG